MFKSWWEESHSKILTDVSLFVAYSMTLTLNQIMWRPVIAQRMANESDRILKKAEVASVCLCLQTAKDGSEVRPLVLVRGYDNVLPHQGYSTLHGFVTDACGLMVE